MLRNVAAVLLGFILAQAAEQTTSINAERTKDAQAVYEALVSSRKGAAPTPSNPVYLIHAETFVPVLDHALVFGVERCVQVPSQRAAAWAELLAEARSGRIVAGVIEPTLKLSKPYLLLRPDEVPSFPTSNPRFQGATDVFRLSVVYFDKPRTLALAYVTIGCGFLCGTGTWAPLEKLPDGSWIERPGWVKCFAIA